MRATGSALTSTPPPTCKSAASGAQSAANQALAAEYLVQHGKELENQVYPVPADLDRQVASLKLAAMGVEIDTLTPQQEEYLTSWEVGT